MNVYDIHRRKRHSRWKGGSSYTSSEFFLSRLTDKQRLDGHRGCVNRLAWHEEGRYLASVSDDRRCLIWDFHSSSASSSSSLTPPQSSPSRTLNGGDQFGHMNPSAVIYTGHAFNIFGVGFLGDTHVATGAMDREVRLSCIRDETFSMVCHCHNGRVKHIATLPRSSQHLWWSASEDGTVRQYDKRVPHICGGSRQLQAANVLISLRPSYSYSSRPAFRISPFSRLSASSGGGDAGATPTDAGATRARAPSSGDSNRRHRRERTDTNRSTSFSSSSRHRQSGRAGEQSGGSLLASRREEDEESGVGSLARQREDRRASQSDFSSERDRGRERDKERRKKEVEDNREDEDRQGEEAERRWGTRRRRTTSSSSSPALERRGSSDMNEDVSAGGGGGQSSLDIRRDRRRRRGKYDREEDRGMFPSSAEGHRRGEEQEEVQRQGRRLSIRGRRYEVYNTIDRRLNLGSERSILTRDLRLLREAYYETQWNPKAALSRGEPQVKAVSINPLRPEYMAIAANDPLIRVYDRRMLSLHTNQPQRSAFSSSSSMPRPSASSSSLSPHHAPDANSNESPPTSRGRSHFLFSAEARGGRRDLRESMPCDVFLPSTFWSVPFEYTPEWQSRFSRLLAATHC
ncbi:wd g-beta repeat-containing protein, partial [Cystoisospora suis]